MENKALMSRLVVTDELCNKCAVQQNTEEVSANKYYKVMDDLEMKNNHGDAHVTHRNSGYFMEMIWQMELFLGSCNKQNVVFLRFRT